MALAAGLLLSGAAPLTGAPADARAEPGVEGRSVSTKRTPAINNTKPATNGAPPTMVHVPPKADKLPYPGQDMTLSVRLTNTRQTSGKLMMALVKDGRLAPVEVPGAYLNEYDQPTYNVVVQAPLGEMTYQFIVSLDNGVIVNSSRYVVRRPCIPDVELGDAEVSADLQGYSRLEKLISASERLKNDLTGYEKVLALIEELQKRVQR